MQDGFTFEGLHLWRDMGCEYYATDPRPIAAAAVRNEYTIAGRSGTVIYPGGTYSPIKESGVIVPLREDGEALGERVRRVAAWLTQPETGRGRLVWDSRPDVYRMAQMDVAPTAGYTKWPRGAMNVTITQQPIARAVTQSRQSVSISGGAAELILLHPTQLSAPLVIELCNTGTQAITGCELAIEGARIALEGLNLTAGQTLRISGEEGDVGAWIVSAHVAQEGAVERIAAWADPCARQGDGLTLALSGGTQALLSVTARGCYL